MKKEKPKVEGFNSGDDDGNMKLNVQLQEKVNVLTSELIRKNKFEADNKFSQLQMGNRFKESRKELKLNNIIVHK